MRFWFVMCFGWLISCGRPHAIDVALPSIANEAPNSAARAWYLKAIRAEALGDFEAAEHHLAWAVRMNRMNPWIHVASGQYFERQQNDEGAIAAYEKAVELGHLAEAYEALGRLYFSQGNDSQGIQALQAAGSEAAYGELGDYFLRNEDHERAELVLREWANFPVSLMWAESRTAIASWLSMPALVWQDYLSVLEHEPSHEAAREALVASRQACQQGRVWRWARDRQVDSRDSRWRAWAIDVADSAGDMRWKERILRRQLDQNESYEIWFHYVREGRFLDLQESVASLRDRPDTDPSLVGFMDGQALRGLHKYDRAIDRWTLVLADDPDRLDVAEALISLRSDQGRTEDAMLVAQAMVIATEGDPRARALVARTYAAAGQHESAFAVVDELPDEVQSAVAVAVHLEQGNLEQASALALQSGDHQLIERVGDWAYQQRRSREVVPLWRWLMDSEPTSVGAWRLVEAGELSIDDALGVSPCQADLLKQKWETAQSCDEISYLERGFQAYPGTFARMYSAASLRCHRYDEATMAARAAVEIEDSAASRRHLDYVLRTVAQDQRARRQP